ncbi:MAG: hypothetical protein QUT30_20920 [Acidobacteriota bacterium]|nr:hypothetical protein [Acidobacteriota bacterium]
MSSQEIDPATRPKRLGKGDVMRMIANGPGPLKIQMVLACGQLPKAGFRLYAVAEFLTRVRAGIPSKQTNAGICQPVANSLIDRCQLPPCELISADPGLIGNHNEAKVRA